VSDKWGSRFRSGLKRDSCSKEFCRIVGAMGSDKYCESLEECTDAEIRAALKKAARN